MDDGVLYDFQTMTVYLSKLRKASLKFHTDSLKSFNITHRHATYIMMLYDSDGMTMKQLSDSLCVDPANTTRVIATLKEKGLVADDCKKVGGRKFNVFLTEKGKSLAAELAAKLKENLVNSRTSMLAGLTEEEKNKFFELCQKIVKTNMEYCEDCTKKDKI